MKNNGVLCRALACLEHRFQTIDPFQFGTLLVLAMPLFQWSMSGHARRTLDSGKSVRTLFVDFTKAFDRVDHTLLLNKMITLGAPPLLVEWMFSFLKGRYHRVKIQGRSSDWIGSNAGMPQGTWLGPLSFIVMIDDLKIACLTHEFVDDVTLTEILPSITTPSIMQNFFAELHSWASTNYM